VSPLNHIFRTNRVIQGERDVEPLKLLSPIYIFIQIMGPWETKKLAQLQEPLYIILVRTLNHF
jgi:hypothetical protein